MAEVGLFGRERPRGFLCLGVGAGKTNVKRAKRALRSLTLSQGRLRGACGSLRSFVRKKPRTQDDKGGGKYVASG